MLTHLHPTYRTGNVVLSMLKTVAVLLDILNMPKHILFVLVRANPHEHAPFCLKHFQERKSFAAVFKYNTLSMPKDFHMFSLLAK